MLGYNMVNYTVEYNEHRQSTLNTCVFRGSEAFADTHLADLGHTHPEHWLHVEKITFDPYWFVDK